MLADAGDVERLLTGVLPWMAVLVGALVALASGVACYRARCRRAEDCSEQPWTLQQLREMHARGNLADAEYQQLRARLLGMSGTTDGNAGVEAADSTGNDGNQ